MARVVVSAVSIIVLNTFMAAGIANNQKIHECPRFVNTNEPYVTNELGGLGTLSNFDDTYAAMNHKKHEILFCWREAQEFGDKRCT